MVLVDQITVKMAISESAAAYLRNKEKQLAKVRGLDERVRTVFVRDAAMVKVHCATRAEPMNAAALRSAVEEEKCVSVADTELEDARLVLRAAASRQEISQEETLRAEVQLLRGGLEEQRGAVLRVTCIHRCTPSCLGPATLIRPSFPLGQNTTSSCAALDGHWFLRPSVPPNTSPRCSKPSSSPHFFSCRRFAFSSLNLLPFPASPICFSLRFPASSSYSSALSCMALVHQPIARNTVFSCTESSGSNCCLSTSALVTVSSVLKTQVWRHSLRHGDPNNLLCDKRTHLLVKKWT